jgi:hypothetical protein
MTDDNHTEGLSMTRSRASDQTGAGLRSVKPR